MKRSVLTRYRVMAWVTAVLLVVLTLGVIGKYVLDIGGADDLVLYVGTAHGWLYPIYLICAFEVCYKAKWPIGRMAWVLLAGTIPTAALFVERRVTRELAPQVIEPETAEPVKA